MMSISDMLRPACSACLERRRIPAASASGFPIGNWGLEPMGYQPLPSWAARRMAGRLSPPTQMGGWGFCTGLGKKDMLEKLQYSPWKDGLSLVHSSLKARMYSLVTAPRSWKGGSPKASNSSCIQPTPTPTMTRPWERTSSVANALAVTTGLRCGTIMTLVPKRIVLV